MDLPTQAIPVWPTVEADVRCPVSGKPLDDTRLVIPGSRVMAAGVADGRRWMVDLPVGAANKAPAAIDATTGETFFDKAHTQWYADQLNDAYRDRHSSASVVPKATVRKSCRNVVIVNCIDHLYGHCLLKLLNCDYHHERDSETGICVLIQPQMRHLVPDYVSEIWEVPVKLGDGVRWFDSIDLWIQDRMPQYDTVSVSRAYSHLSPRYYDIKHFVGHRITPLPELNSRNPIVHFSCRDDRCWGVHAEAQNRRLKKLYFQLRRRFERLAFVVSGFGTPMTFSDSFHQGFHDLRTTTLTKEIEDKWISSMAVADVAVGVHGSNMLLPTSMATSSLILLPQVKHQNIALDLLMPEAKNEVREEMLNYAFVYGDQDLLDVTPKRVAGIIANLLGYCQINLEWFRNGPDYQSGKALDEMLSVRERVSAVHRVERNNLSGAVKSSVHRLLTRLAACVE